MDRYFIAYRISEAHRREAIEMAKSKKDTQKDTQKKNTQKKNTQKKNTQNVLEKKNASYDIENDMYDWVYKWVNF